MNYLVIAIFAYFVVAVEIILDKFLLTSKKISHPVIYAFYSGVLTAFVFFMIPFGFHWIGFQQAVISIATGVIFVYGILALFFAINKSEASRVMPVVGATIPVMTFFLSVLFSIEKLASIQIAGVAALIIGGLLISFELPLKSNRLASRQAGKFFQGFYYAILAGILLAIEAVLFKYLGERDGFVNVFIWTRWGVVLGALSLLLFSNWRGVILNSFKGTKKSSNENYKTGGLFVFNKVLGGVGSVLTKKAITMGSATIVNALVSVEYVFILLIGLLLSFEFPAIFQEKKAIKSVAQKIISIIIISIGVALISWKHKI